MGNDGVDSLMVVGTCNGLLCLCIVNCCVDSLMVYNPTTQTHRLLPVFPAPMPLRSNDVVYEYGFGFDSVSNDYKCVRIGLPYFDESYREVLVYSLNHDCEKRVPGAPYYDYNYRGSPTNVLLHETVHLLGYDGCDDSSIFAFRLQDEKFRSIRLPGYDEECHSTLNIGVLDGCLCFVVDYLNGFDVWVMKEYGVAGSWKRMINFIKEGDRIEIIEGIISYSRSGKELFVRLLSTQVACVNLETMKMTHVKVAGFVQCYDAYLCVENLLMLKEADRDDGEEEQRGKKKRRRMRKRR